MPLTLSNTNGSGNFRLSNNNNQGNFRLSSTTTTSIVTDGLTLRLDAVNTSSYPGSGSTWFDLAGTQQNITLVGSPTYTSASPSYFTFNGLSQYGTGTGAVLTSTSYTKSVWFYMNSFATNNNLVSSAAGGHFTFFGATNKLHNGHANWSNYLAYPSTTTFSLNTWYNATLTFNTTDGMVLYVNGTLDSTYTANKTSYSGNGSTDIASFGASNLLGGRIAKVYCYNRSITAAEVLQNYNADKAKFGL